MTGNFPSFFELFEPCFVLGQKKTPTVLIEFSKESTLRKKRKPAPNKASKTILTQRKPFLTKKNVYLRWKTRHCFRLRRNRPKKTSPAAKQTVLFILRLRWIRNPTFFLPCGEKGAAQEKRASARTKKKARFSTKTYASATFHHLLYALWV